MSNFFKKNPHLLVLLGILLIGTFFRTYALIDRYGFAHDGDLFSWIVKDIVVDKHFRLIGQETTAPGIFIGPSFYWLLIPFFLLLNMDPVGAVIPITIMGVLTVLSYYIVFARLYGTKAGLIAAFLQAVLLAQVWEDRRVVPSTPTNLWTIWYFFTVVSIARGNFKVLPILGILVGLIWHIHIALLPALIAVPTAVVLAKKLPTKKQLAGFVLTLTITSIPLILFELRHNFSQTLAFIHDLGKDHGGGTGIEKLNLVIIKFTSTIIRLLFYPQGLPIINHTLFIFGLLASSFFLVRQKLLAAKEVFLFLIWISGLLLFYSISSSFISEYYFSNVNVIFIGIVSLWLSSLFGKGKARRYAVVAVLAIILLKNLAHHTKDEAYKAGYKERKGIAEFIAKDAKSQGFPCIAVSYITTPGENVGFRYLFWLNHLHVNQPKSGSPVYTIVLPPELAEGKDSKMFGQIKVIPPEKVGSKEEIVKSCSGQNSNLTDPMFGFTN